MTADKRRTDACLKACEGISTQNLEDNVPVLELARRYNVVLRERDALQAKIEAMERQEPVGKFIRHPSNGLWEQDGYGDNPDARPLYSLPGAQPAPSIPDGWKAAPVEVVDLYSFMCAAFVPMTPQQDQIAIQLDLAKRAMLTSSLGLVDQAMTRSAAIRARGDA